MPGISRIGVDLGGGGIILGVIQDGTVFANGALVSVDGDPIAGHGPGPHAAPITIAGSNNVFVNGIAVVNAGDPASCGHPATGSGNVFVGD